MQKDLTNLEVMHTCHNRKCCNPNHLVLGTHRENMEAMAKRGSNKGENNGNCKVTEDVVRMIRSMSGSLSQIGGFFNISKDQVHQIRSRKTWKHL